MQFSRAKSKPNQGDILGACKKSAEIIFLLCNVGMGNKLYEEFLLIYVVKRQGVIVTSHILISLTLTS